MTKEFCFQISKLESVSYVWNVTAMVGKSMDWKSNANYTLENKTMSQFSVKLDKYLRFICEKENEITLFKSSNQVKFTIIQYIYPLILICGILGNILSFFAMIKVYKKKIGSRYRFSLNLAILSLADLAVLIFGCFREYSEEILEWHLRSMNMFMCKFIYFNCYLFSCYSAYLHVFISIERWYAISRPIKSKTNPLKNKKIIFIIFSMCVFISLPYIYIAKIKTLVNINKKNPLNLKILYKCEAAQESFISDLVMAIFDLIFFFKIPFLSIFLFSSVSLIKLFQNKRNFNFKVDFFSKKRNSIQLSETNSQTIKATTKTRNSSKSETISNKGIRLHLINLFSRQPASNSSFSHITGNSSIKINLHRINSSSSSIKQTLILMTLPISYVITNFSIFIILILQFYPFNDHSTNEYELELVIARVLMYINNSVNIFYYVFLGNSFRQVFKELTIEAFNLKFIR